jgi:hypothetical protein
MILPSTNKRKNQGKTTYTPHFNKMLKNGPEYDNKISNNLKMFEEKTIDTLETDQLNFSKQKMLLYTL